ncbi:MAG: hypothetical protein A2563_03300 [Candidatus Magasanikbacteria bacterium RIFOXYD1_FULL_40_23]|uniref:Uncharacterized protein n=1 Tax=Candidatus Magasanikbacteria bacterium RIFOXYD1_FULL_40_23 TaxID=1798705 RepID=A0A1F6P9P7_9BACT|nr:MAG: hypothetical protein A2563_03300 [Candidatus Magasanikbacteria bacterium RIFOXYD1_FULL_40_23]
MSNRQERGIGEENIEVFQNPDKPVVEASPLAPGVLKVKRGDAPPSVNKVDRATAQARLDSLKGPGSKIVGGGSAPSRNGKFSR